MTPHLIITTLLRTHILLDYHIAGKLILTRNLIWRIDRPTIKLKPTNIKSWHCVQRTYIYLLYCLPNFMLMPVEAYLPNLIPTKSKFRIYDNITTNYYYQICSLHSL